MARVSLLSALSLDGSWTTSQLDSKNLAALRTLADPRQPTAPLLSDIPAWRTRRIPGLHFANSTAIQNAIKAAGKRDRLLIAGTPKLQADLLAAGLVETLILLWQAEICLGPTRTSLTAPFLPPNGKRVRFALRRIRPVAGGILCRYERGD